MEPAKMDEVTRFFEARPVKAPSQLFLTGLRGFLVIQSFLWIFLSTFVPASVKDSANPDGPLYQIVLRKTLSVLFWNESLIYSCIILLSARVLALPFFLSPSRTVVASSVFRRGIRLWLPTAVALATITGVSHALRPDYISSFAEETGNHSISNPYQMPNTLAYFNSVFDVFWVTRDWDLQAASRAFPGQTLWIVSVIFEQSYTVFMTMVIVPYTQKGWRIIGGFFFIITAWWVDSWAWYTITGLLLADAVTNMNFPAHSRGGISIPFGRLNLWNKHDERKFTFPSWIIYLILCIAGLVMQYIWTDIRPDVEDAELRIHTGEYYSGGLNTVVPLSLGLPRDDDYLLLLGFFLLLDTMKWIQWIFSTRILVALGKRSFSWFLIQGTMIYTVGIKLFQHLTISQNVAFEGAAAATLVVCLLVVIATGEVFYRFVDLPVQKFAIASFEWIRT